MTATDSDGPGAQELAGKLFQSANGASRHAAAVLVLLAGILLSVVLFGAMRRSEREAIAANYDQRYDNAMWLLGNSYANMAALSNLQVLATAKAGYRGEAGVSQEDLDSWGVDLLDHELYRTYLMWLPRVSVSTAASYEGQLLAWRPGLHLAKGAEAEESVLRVGSHREYFPVHLVTPRDRGAGLVGHDPASDPLVRAVMEWVRDTGRSARIERFPIDVEKSTMNEWFHFVPVFRGGAVPESVNERRQALAGFLATLFVSPITSLGLGGSEFVALEQPVTTSPYGAAPALELRYVAANRNDYAYEKSFIGAVLEDEQRPIRATTIEQSGRRWSLLSYPSRQLVDIYHTRAPAAVLIAGLLLSAVASLWLVRAARQSSRFDALVAKRALAFRESEERYTLAARGATDGLWDWDLKHDKIYYSPRWKEALGFEEYEIGDTKEEWFSRVHPDDISELKEAVTAHLENQDAYFETEYRMRDKKGVYRWMLSRGIAVRNDENGVPYRLVGSQSEITKRKLAEQRLQHDALHDALTGLPNRAHFMDRLQRALDRNQRDSECYFAVLFLDIDRFKVVNDSLGHISGDELLVRVAERVKSCLRPTDMVARLGGDEFTVLITDFTNLSQVRELTERIQQRLCEPMEIHGQEVFVTASIGITLSSNGYQAAAHVLRDADIAMYQAKAQGAARYEIFNLNMRNRAAEILELETDLRRALERQELRVVYQPIVELKTQRVRGFEALMRWARPRRELVLPEEFIKVAEEMELIVPFGLWVLEQACRQAKDWLDQLDPAQDQDLLVSVNLSPRQLREPGFDREVTRILQETGLAAKHLMLEITESTMIDDAQSHVETIRRIQDIGARVLIDDFGTGYSSLHYLDRFRVDGLKVDRTFVNTDIVGAIVRFAHNLDLEVIAEGVETNSQIQRLEAFGCDYAQGHYFSPPVDTGGVEQLLSAQQGDQGPDSSGRVLRSSRFRRPESAEKKKSRRSIG